MNKLEEKVLSNITEIEKLMDDLHVSNSLEKMILLLLGYLEDQIQ